MATDGEDGAEGAAEQVVITELYRASSTFCTLFGCTKVCMYLVVATLCCSPPPNPGLHVLHDNCVVANLSSNHVAFAMHSCPKYLC